MSADRATCILVLGMHRSGTSAVTGLLGGLGVAMPRHPVPADSHNEGGYFEPVGIVALNEELLAEAGSRTDDWRRFEADRLTPERLAFYRAAIGERLREDFAGAAIFALKDPRICRLAALYLEALDAHSIDTNVLLVLRDPAAVAASLAHRDGVAKDYGYLLWLRHILDAERQTRSRPRVFVRYEQLLRRPDEVSRELVTGLRLRLPVTARNQHGLRPELRHHDDTLPTGRASPLVALVHRAYDALCGLAEGKTGPASDLDAVACELDFAGSIAGDATMREVGGREQRLRRSTRYFEELAAARQTEITRLESLARERQTEIARLRETARHGETTASRLAAENAALADRLALEHTALTTARTEVAARDVELTALRRDAEEHARSSVAMRAGLAAAQARESRSHRERDLASAQAEEARIERDIALTEMRRIVGSRSYRFAGRLAHVYRASPMLRTLAGAAARLRRPTPARNAPLVDGDLRDALVRSGLFDADYYAERYSDSLALPDDPLGDFLVSPPGMRDPGPLFSARHYLNLHHDVAAEGLNPLVHFVRYGMREGRPAFSPQRVRQFLSDAPSARLAGLREILDPTRPVTVLVAADGNFFFRDIAAYLGSLLAEQGFDVAVETEMPANGAATTPVVVAPHEYFLGAAGSRWSHDQIAAAAYVNTEQWQTSWFAACFRHLTISRIGVLDINPNSAAGLARLGQRAAFLPILPLAGSVFARGCAPISPQLARLKYLPPMTVDPRSIGERPIDISFVGVMNTRRAKTLARLSPTLAQFDCFIHAPRFDRPIQHGDPDMIGTEDFARIAANSKILLNIHRDDVGYLEWHRVVLYGILNGCVVVTEPCFENRFITAGENYLEAPVAALHELLGELLTTPHGRDTLERISANNAALARRIAAGERFLS